MVGDHYEVQVDGVWTPAHQPQARKGGQARTDQARHQMGGWFMINDRNLLVDKFIDLERLGRETGVLREYERLEG